VIERMSRFKGSANRLGWTLRRFGLTPPTLVRRVVDRRSPKVLCVSLPKAGTHLLERAICLHPALYRKIVPTVSGANLARWGDFDGLLARIRPGQVLVSHLHFRPDYPQTLAQRGVRPIFLMRDPHAIVVSQTHYVAGRRDHRLHSAFVRLTESERMRLAIVGDPHIDMPSIGARLDSFAGWITSGALVVRFEDLVGPAGGGEAATQEATVAAIYRYLGLAFDDELLRSVCARLFSSNSPTFRRGSADGWKKSFTPEMQAMFADVVGERLQPYGYRLSNDA
jgi:hypothetical protein